MTSTNTERVELAVGGMTCASCAARVEKRLNRLEGVTATVNFATETATALVPAGTPVDELVAAVVAAVAVDLDTGAVTVTSHDPLDIASIRSAVDEAGYELTT